MKEKIKQLINKVESFYKGFYVYSVEDNDIIVYVYIKSDIVNENMKLVYMKTFEFYQLVGLEEVKQ